MSEDILLQSTALPSELSSGSNLHRGKRLYKSEPNPRQSFAHCVTLTFSSPPRPLGLMLSIYGNSAVFGVNSLKLVLGACMGCEARRSVDTVAIIDNKIEGLAVRAVGLFVCRIHPSSSNVSQHEFEGSLPVGRWLLGWARGTRHNTSHVRRSVRRLQSKYLDHPYHERRVVLIAPVIWLSHHLAVWQVCWLFGRLVGWWGLCEGRKVATRSMSNRQLKESGVRRGSCWLIRVCSVDSRNKRTHNQRVVT